MSNQLTQVKVSLFIPTLNAINKNANVFIATLDIIARANLHRVLIIDSSSTDDTEAVVNSYGFECIVISKDKFNHGATRQLAFETLCDSDIIIYLTQDVLLLSTHSLSTLTQILIDNPTVAGAYGRQLPHNNADKFATHLRKFNYKDKSYITSYNDRYVRGMRCVFSSNSFAAYNVQALQKINGFPLQIIFGEDVYLFAKFLVNGYQVAYVANATCLHSHNYSVLDDFKRYFDIGVFHRSEGWILREFGSINKDGIKYIFSEYRAIFPYIWLWPKAITKTLAKYLGYKLGRNYDSLGVRLCRKFSMNKSFWW